MNNATLNSVALNSLSLATSKESSSKDLNVLVETSEYKWMSSKLKSVLDNQTLRPYFKAYIKDDLVLALSGQIFSQPLQSSAVRASNGDIFVVGKAANGDLGFWKITDGTVNSQWDSSPDVVLKTSGNWNDDFNVSIAVSEYINGTYVIDIYYFTGTDETNLRVNRQRSSNGGTSFADVGVALVSSYAFTDNVNVCAVKPFLKSDGTVDGMYLVTRRPSSSQIYDIYYDYFDGSSWGGYLPWNLDVDTDEWYLHSLDAYRISESNIKVVFSGYHTLIESGSQLSLFSTSFLKFTSDLKTDLWTAAEEVLTIQSGAAQNISNFSLPRLSFDGEYLWLTFKGETVLSIQENGEVNTQINYYSMKTKDFQNFNYPSLLSLPDGTTLTDSFNFSFCKQGLNYFLSGGQGKVWTFKNNNLVADITDEVLGFEIDENIVNSSVASLQLGNQDGQWYGPSPTKENYQAIQKDRKIIIFSGFYNSEGVAEAVPKNIFLIDDIAQLVSVNRNDLSFSSRDFLKNLINVVNKYTYNFRGTNLLFDATDGSTIRNWNQKYGAWSEQGGYLLPTSTASESQEYKVVLSGMNIKEQDYMLACKISLPNTNPHYATVYPFFVDEDNWIRAKFIYAVGTPNLKIYDLYIQRNVNGVITTYGISSIPVFATDYDFFIPVFIKVYEGNKFNFIIGSALDGGDALLAYHRSYIITDAVFAPQGEFSFSTLVNKDTCTIAFGSVGTNTKVTNITLVQYRKNQNVEDSLVKIASKASIFDYKFEKLREIELFSSDGWEGNFSIVNRRLTLGESQYALLTDEQYADAEIEFEAMIEPDVESLDYSFDVLFRTQNNDDSEGYFFRVLKSTDDVSSGENISVKAMMNQTTIGGYPEVILMSTNLCSTSYADPSFNRFNNLKFDLTIPHKYTLKYDKKWLSLSIDGVSVLSWYDVNSQVSDFLTGFVGFRAGVNSTLKVWNIKFNLLSATNNNFAVNIGESFRKSYQNILDSSRAFGFFDQMNRLKIVKALDTDESSFSYENAISQNDVNNSDVEYYNQITVIGSSVSYVARDLESISVTGKVKDKVIVDFKIVSLDDAIKRANAELIDSKKFNNQNSLSMTLNPGSEMMDVVHVKNSDSLIDKDVRIYTQKTTVNGNPSSYSMSLGTGEIS